MGSQLLSDFPTTSGAFSRTFSDGNSKKKKIAFRPIGLNTHEESGVDMFLTRINSKGTRLIASTYVGRI